MNQGLSTTGWNCFAGVHSLIGNSVHIHRDKKINNINIICQSFSKDLDQNFSSQEKGVITGTHSQEGFVGEVLPRALQEYLELEL